MAVSETSLSNPESTHRLGTLALHAGQEPDPTTGARAVPIYSTTSYVFHDTEHAANLFALKEFGFIYSRLMNPTCDVLEKRMAALEGGAAALAFASGQAATTAAILTITHSGQNFISSTSLYGGTHTLFTQTLKNLGIEVRFFNPDRPEDIHQLVDANTRLVFLESIGNPKNDVPDFDEVSAIAHSHGLPVLMDNTVLTPALFRPFEHGVDISIYSTTKFLGGHGVHIGGIVVDSGKFPWAENPKKWPEFTEPDPSYHGVVFVDALAPIGNIAYIIYMRTHWLRDTGAAMSPYAAFLFLLGIETLHLRMERHTANAQAFAEWLAAHPAVEWVNYPGLPNHPHHANALKYIPGGPGAIVGFGIKGGKAAGVKLIDSVKLASHLANLGDAKTLVIHPASTTHQQLNDEEQLAAGVRPEYIRVSVGIEHIDDIRADFEQALAISQL
jgi:O-acetylhomoserine (thiol)-lyase